jgi:hypothetical protein
MVAEYRLVIGVVIGAVNVNVDGEVAIGVVSISVGGSHRCQTFMSLCSSANVKTTIVQIIVIIFINSSVLRRRIKDVMIIRASFDVAEGRGEAASCGIIRPQGGGVCARSLRVVLVLIQNSSGIVLDLMSSCRMTARLSMDAWSVIAVD